MAYLNTTMTTSDEFLEWLDTTPLYKWDIVEKAAQLYSLDPDQGRIGMNTSMGGMCMALHIMSGHAYDVIERFVRGFAKDNYDCGERIQ